MTTLKTIAAGLVVGSWIAISAGQTIDQAKIVDLQKLGKAVEETQSQLSQILTDRGVPELQKKVLENLANNADPQATSAAMRDLAQAQRSVLESWDRTVTAKNFEVLEKIDHLRAGFSGEAAGRTTNPELMGRADRMDGALDELAKQIQKMPEGPARQRMKERFARLFLVQKKTREAAERPGNAALNKALLAVNERLGGFADSVEAAVFDTEMQRIDLIAQVELLEQLADVMQIVGLGEGLKANNGLKSTGALSGDVVEKLIAQLDKKLGTAASRPAGQPPIRSAEIESEIYRRATGGAAPNREGPQGKTNVTVPASQPSRSYLDVLRPQSTNAQEDSR